MAEPRNEDSGSMHIEDSIEVALGAMQAHAIDPRAHETSAQIELVEPEPIPGIPNTAESIKALAAKRRDILVTYDEREIIRLTVPQSVFNPYQTVAARVIVDKIMNGTIDVRGKRVVDLGCGCGILGMATRLMGCTSVLYTDLNPRVVCISGHELFRAGIDRVAVQDMCVNEQPASADIVLISMPSLRIAGAVAADSIESAYCRDEDFIPHLIENVSRVLVAGGEFVFFYRFYSERMDDFVDLITRLSLDFDIDRLKLLWNRQESDRVACLFSVTRSR